MNTRFAPALRGLGLAAAVAAVSAPALAQDYYEGEEIVVYGSYERLPDDVRSASQRVSYADLDLATPWGWDEFRYRIRTTARFLCDRLGEPRNATPPRSSCRRAAERDALRRLGTHAQLRAPRDTAWVAGPAWVPPYLAGWRE